MTGADSALAQDFARHVQQTNPFTQDRVTQVQTHQADVGAIHDKAFKKLLRRIEEVRQSQETAGILLTGDAGVGKSHVLARLFRWANEEGQATVVFLHNIQSSPERTGRYILHATVNELAGNRPENYAQSQLYQLINLAILARLEGKSKGMPNLATRREVLQKIGREIDPDQLVMPVFVAFLEQAVGANLAEESAEARALAAVQWLSGETIDPDVARGIGLAVSSEDGAAIVDDVAVQRALDVVCRLCACANRPFVLCLDQIDNLPKDRVQGLMSFLHAAIDNGRNLVVVTSGVKRSMDELEKNGVIPTAAFDRIAQRRVQLESVSMADARSIVVGRIDKFCGPFAKLKPLASAREGNPFAPLSSAWWDKYSSKLIEARPRDVVRAARDAWDDEQERVRELGPEKWLGSLGKAHPPVAAKVLPPLDDRIDQLVGRKVTEAVNTRKLNSTRLPPDADNLATLTLTLLQVCIGVPTYTIRRVESVTSKEKSGTYSLWALEQSPAGAEVSNGLSFFTNDNALSATNLLKRLKGDEPPPTHQLLVTDEERRPIRLATKGRDVYEELTRSPRFEHVKLRFEDHAQLDAFSSVLGAARVGDLDVEVEPGSYRALTEEECKASLHRKRMFLEHPLLRILLTEEPGPPPSTFSMPSGAAGQVRGQIKGELSLALSMTAREMATIILSRTSQSQHHHAKIWEMVKVVAQQMHKDGELFVDAEDDDLYLQLRNSK